jgi:hypothetical protein
MTLITFQRRRTAGTRVWNPRRAEVVWATLAALTLAPSDAHAYIDPGSGSLVYQALLAAALGAGFVFRAARARLIDAWRALRSRREDPSSR